MSIGNAGIELASDGGIEVEVEVARLIIPVIMRGRSLPLDGQG